MRPEELEIGKYYSYENVLGETVDGSHRRWSIIHRVKFLGDVTIDHPELGVTHCSRYLFIGSEQHEILSVGVCATTFLLADYEIKERLSKIAVEGRDA